MNRRLSRLGRPTAMAVLLFSFGAALAGCGVAGPAPLTSTPPSSPTTLTSAPTQGGGSTTPSVAPASTAPTSSEPRTSNPTATPIPTDVTPPPAGSIGAEGDTGVVGQPGSWCYDGTCLDGPPPPKSMLPVAEPAAGANLQFRIADSHPFNHWTASYQETLDNPAVELASGGDLYDPDLASSTLGPLMSSFDFEGPPHGSWIVSVSLQFADRGDAIFFWHFDVP